MANPNPEAVAWILARSPDFARTDAEIAADLNAETVPNPAPQPTVRTPFVTTDLMGALNAASLAKIKGLPSLARLLDDITAQLPGPLDNWLILLQTDGTISPTQAGAMAAIVHATGPDPSWPPTIPAAVADLGRELDAADIAASRPGA